MRDAPAERLRRGPLAIAALALALAGCDACGGKRSGPSPAASGADLPPGIASAAPAALPADAAPTRPAPLNVVLISVDSLRADMPWAGYARDIAPNMSALARRSVTYTNAYSVSSYTSMSLGGLLSGRPPSELERSGFFFGKYPDKNLFFPELLQAAGVRTVAAQAHWYFQDAGFEQGFDVWEMVPGLKKDNTTDTNVTSPQHEALAEKVLSDPALGQARFFAWFHFMDPHDQYVSHEADGIPPFGPKERDRYDAEVLFTDRFVGKLLAFIEAQPWGERTAILLTSDHGEGFGEHGRHAHGFELWENLVRVPLMVRLPGVTPRQIDAPRGGLDLAPTILELMGVDKPASMKGESLVSEVRGAEAKPRDVLLDLPATSDNGYRRAIVRGRKKALAIESDATLRAFDLDADPGEDKPLGPGPDRDALFDRLRAASKAITPVMPYACGPSCLNGAYQRKAP